MNLDIKEQLNKVVMVPLAYVCPCASNQPSEAAAEGVTHWPAERCTSTNLHMRHAGEHDVHQEHAQRPQTIWGHGHHGIS